jgi:hypothetical protein
VRRNAAAMGRYPLDDSTLRNPTSGVIGCCACAASGPDTAVLTRAVTNSRRLMGCPVLRTTQGRMIYHILERQLSCASQQIWPPMSALGSNCDVAVCLRHGSFTPQS